MTYNKPDRIRPRNNLNRPKTWNNQANFWQKPSLMILIFAVFLIGFVLIIAKNKPDHQAENNQNNPNQPEIKTMSNIVNQSQNTQTCHGGSAQTGYKVGIQAGHWQNEELPDELDVLRDIHTGGEVDGLYEWEVNLQTAEEVKKLLQNKNIEVDLIPATVPQDYCADVFVSIHADGNDDTSVYGYKVSESYFDQTNLAPILSQEIDQAYQSATSMIEDPNITDDMTQYYAFNHVKFHHSINPKTPAAIIEIGFLTNAQDRYFMLNQSQKTAQGIADGILSFLNQFN